MGADLCFDFVTLASHQTQGFVDDHCLSALINWENAIQTNMINQSFTGYVVLALSFSLIVCCYWPWSWKHYSIFELLWIVTMHVCDCILMITTADMRVDGGCYIAMVILIFQCPVPTYNTRLPPKQCLTMLIIGFILAVICSYWSSMNTSIRASLNIQWLILNFQILRVYRLPIDYSLFWGSALSWWL